MIRLNFMMVFYSTLMFITCKSLESQCKVNKENKVYDIEDQYNSKPLNQIDEDKIDVNTSDYSLKAWKKGNLVNIEYILKTNGKTHNITFYNESTSDVIFPIKSIAFVDKSMKKERFYINKNLLVIPLIGINNELNVYIINLETDELLAQDLRTSLNYLWIDKKNNFSMVISNTPVDNYPKFQYELIKYDLQPNNLKEIKRKRFLIDEIIGDDFNKEYQLVKKL